MVKTKEKTMQFLKFIKFLLGEKNRRMISKVLMKYRRSPPAHVSNIFGFDLYQNNLDIINYAKWSGKNIVDIKDDPDGRVIKLINESVKDGDIVLDIGANIGLMTLVLGKKVGKFGKVYSFEPGPISHSLLARNVYANIDKTGEIVFFKQAMTDVDGPVELFINRSGESDNQVHRGVDEYIYINEKSRKKVIVDGITLDSFAATFQSLKVRFIKMDTQGHEYYIFLGGKKFLKSAREIIIHVEYAPYLKAWENFSQDDFYDLIKELDFEIFDTSNMQYGKVDNKYLKNNYGFDFVGKYTDLLLVK